MTHSIQGEGEAGMEYLSDLLRHVIGRKYFNENTK